MLSAQDFVVNLLLEEGLLSPENHQRAVAEASSKRQPLTDVILAMGLISPRELAVCRAVVCEMPFVDVDRYETDLQNAALLPRTIAEKQLAFPLFVMERSVTVAMADPADLAAVDRLRSALKTEVDPVLAEPGALRGLIEKAYALVGATGGRMAEQSAKPAATPVGADEEPIIAAVNQIISQAATEGASDIHIGPDESELSLRYRLDGHLVMRQGPGLASHPALVQRIKVMANLDLTQTRRPQDGKFRFAHHGRPLDVRVSIIPTIWGENVVMRLLSGAAALTGCEALGFSPRVARDFEELVEHAHGMMLVTGPTGSGKTTTLYTALKRLNRPDRNVVTIEDPVEIRLPMVRHVQANAEIGMTFASALRSILRQDPDVVLIGEIRDEETARIALQAALTGHMVLSTLHTNDAPGAIARMIDFHCPPFAINAALSGVLAQRLVRRVCPACSAPASPDASLINRFCPDHPGAQFRAGPGCGKCSNIGYRGRVGLYELMRTSPALKRGIETGAGSEQIRQIALQEGMRPLWLDGVDKAMLGVTTLDEVARIAAASVEADAALAPVPAVQGSETQSYRLSA